MFYRDGWMVSNNEVAQVVYRVDDLHYYSDKRLVVKEFLDSLDSVDPEMLKNTTAYLAKEVKRHQEALDALYSVYAISVGLPPAPSVESEWEGGVLKRPEEFTRALNSQHDWLDWAEEVRDAVAEREGRERDDTSLGLLRQAVHAHFADLKRRVEFYRLCLLVLDEEDAQ